MKLTIPGYLCHVTAAEQRLVETLFRNFGNARRRAYRLKQKQVPKADIEKILQSDHALNSRYAKDAYSSITSLPSHVTFGGLATQRLREKGKITREEYRQRRNSFLLSRGDRAKKGNLNLRLDLAARTLRITTCDPTQKWIFPSIFIPQKYLARYGALLDGTHPYTVVLKRRAHDQWYDLRITITIPQEVTIGPRMLTLDVNAGHTEFSVLDKPTGRLLALGKLTHPETQYTRSGRREAVLHQLVDKIGKIAQHYQAEVVTGKLNTRKFKSHRRATRTVRQMPQYRFRQLLAQKLARRGIRVSERSEAYTSKGGAPLSQLLGVDVHHCAAVLFGLKVINYPLFRAVVTLLTQGPSDEGDGSLRRRQRRGSGLTAPDQNGWDGCPGHSRRKFWSAMRWLWWPPSISGSGVGRPHGGYSAIPGSWGLSFLESLKSPFAYLNVKIS